MTVFLEVVSGPSAGATVEIPAGASVQVGRTARAQVVFAGDQHMSGLHFALERQAAGLAIRDLSSRNGTFVNGQRVDHVLVAEGDRIQAGSTEAIVHVGPDSGAVAGTPAVTGAQSSPGGAVSLAATVAHSPAIGAPASAGEEVGAEEEQETIDLPESVPRSIGPRPSPGPRPTPVSVAASPAALDSAAGAGSAPGTSSAAPPMLQSVGQSGLLDAPWLPPLTPETTKLLELLHEKFQPLYAILDAARDPTVLAILFQSDQEYQSLYEGAEGQKLAVVAPYLVRLPKDSPLLEVVVRASWGKSWGVFLTSDSPFAEVRRHLRQFLMVKLPEGKQVYFRFYDPRVLRVYLPTCTAEETRTFLGPLKCYLVDGEEPREAWFFATSSRGAEKKVVVLMAKD